MPMFYTPKPRQFHYKPWFYDPQKEELENLQKKYKLQQENEIDKTNGRLTNKGEEGDLSAKVSSDELDKELEYFEHRLREIDREEREARQKMTIADFFRRREMPKFNYVSRFDSEGNLLETPPTASKNAEVKRRIQRRFDNDDDWDRFKPIPAGKIMISTLLVCLLLFIIFS